MRITIGMKDGEVWHLPFSQISPVFGDPYSAALDVEIDETMIPLSFFENRYYIIDSLLEFMPYFAGGVRPYIHPSNGDVFLLNGDEAIPAITNGKPQIEKIDFEMKPPESLVSKYSAVVTPAFLNIASVPKLPAKLYFSLSDRDDAEEIELDLRTKWHIYSAVKNIPYITPSYDQPLVTTEELLKQLSELCNIEYLLSACHTNAEKYCDIAETPVFKNKLLPKISETCDYHTYMLNLVLTRKNDPLLYSRLLAVRFLLGIYNANTERGLDL